MGTNTSKSSAYAGGTNTNNTPRRTSASTGGVQPTIRYINVTYGGNGVSRMGGIHPQSKKKNRSTLGSNDQLRTRNANVGQGEIVDHSAGHRRAQTMIEGINAVDQPPPPYSR